MRQGIRPKRSRPRDRDRVGPQNATGVKRWEGGGTVGPNGLESASRETCQHVK